MLAPNGGSGTNRSLFVQQAVMKRKWGALGRPGGQRWLIFNNPSEQFSKLFFSKLNRCLVAGSKGAPRPSASLLLWESALCREAPSLLHSSLGFGFVLVKSNRSATVWTFPS